MKSFTTITALVALLSAGAQAVPSAHGHGHARRHAGRRDVEKRSLDVFWVTEVTTELVTVYSTVYLDGPTGEAQAAAVATSSSTSTSSSTTTTSTTPTTVAAAATTLQTTTSPAPAPVTTSSSTTTTTPSPSPTTTSTTSVAAVYVPPTTTTSAAPAATTTASSGGSGGAVQDGEVTFYEFTDGALGACGNPLTTTGLTVAISPNLYGTSANPNNSPMCGKQVNIIGTDGTTYTATVEDRCEACDDTHLDLTYGLFGSVTGDNYNAGVVQIQWSWA